MEAGHMNDLASYKAESGKLVPVWTLEVQTLPEDTDRILDAVMDVHPLSFGRYQRNASISAVGLETAQPESGSTTTTHVEGFDRARPHHSGEADGRHRACPPLRGTGHLCS